ncbi:MAG: PIG-L family deacetylase [Chloroflexi bacterium]|nr:PIG-L family deacetylase [Chloroflexota bacterium]
MKTVLHVAPHPDDESLGAPCTLLGLAERGAQVVVVACGLGQPADHARRRAELESATAAAGFEMVVRDPPAALSSGDDLDAAQRELVPWVIQLLDGYNADLVVGPHRHDVHPAHETVAAVIADAVPAARRPPVWWAWSIWADLREPTLLVPCSNRLVEQALAVLECYSGEVARNHYPAMLRAAGRLDVVRGVERVLGFGAAALPGVCHAELLTEFGWDGRAWRRGVPRVDPEPGLPEQWGDALAG